jgi:hypothetical protein
VLSDARRCIALATALALGGCSYEWDSLRPAPDGGREVDAGTADAGTADAGTADAGTADVGDDVVDVTVVIDDGVFDAGTADTGPRDVGTIDAGTTDTGPRDTGPVDAGTADAGPRDAGLVDAGTADAGPPPCTGPQCACALAVPTGWCAIGATCTAGACVAGQLVGALVITEIMNDPDAVNDMVGEWFELYNRAATPVDLRGLRVHGSGTESFEVTGATPIVVAGNGYAVLGINADTAVNGGVTMAFAYGTAMTLGNSNTDTITLVASDNSTVIDTVTYGTTVASGWTITPGRSKSLRPAFLDDISNNTASNWCAGGPAFGRGDFGTPGAANFCQ